jgi:hypothetical protein
MPAWLQNDGAWIAIGTSLVFVVAGGACTACSCAP